MICANNGTAGTVRMEAPTYTVAAKSGQHGTFFIDPIKVVQAFARVSERVLPFVLRHRGNRPIVIANTRRRHKRFAAYKNSEGGFLMAFRSFEAQVAAQSTEPRDRLKLLVSSR